MALQAAVLLHESTKVGRKSIQQLNRLGLFGHPSPDPGFYEIPGDRDSQVLTDAEMARATLVLANLDRSTRSAVGMAFLTTAIRGWWNEDDPVADTSRMLKAAIKWRLARGGVDPDTNNLRHVFNERIPGDSTAFEAVFGGEILHGHDKHGHMLIASRLKSMNGRLCDQIVGAEGGMARCRKLRVQLTEITQLLKWRDSRARKHRILRHSIIFDLAGFALGDLTHASVVKQLLEIGNLNYPECVHRIFFVNAPLLFKVFWKIMGGFIHEETRAKVVPLGNPKSAAKKMFEMDGILLKDLPLWMGGSSKGTCLLALIHLEIHRRQQKKAPAPVTRAKVPSKKPERLMPPTRNTAYAAKEPAKKIEETVEELETMKLETVELETVELETVEELCAEAEKCEREIFLEKNSLESSGIPERLVQKPARKNRCSCFSFWDCF